MAVQSAQVTVNDSADLLASAGQDALTVIVANRATVTNVYLGPAGVTDTTGYLLKPDDKTPPLTLLPGESLYGVTAAAGSAAVHVLRVQVGI